MNDTNVGNLADGLVVLNGARRAFRPDFCVICVQENKVHLSWSGRGILEIDSAATVTRRAAQTVNKALAADPTLRLVDDHLGRWVAIRDADLLAAQRGVGRRHSKIMKTTMIDINVDDDGEGLTQQDREAGADFAGIADRIEHIHALQRDGWLNDANYDYEQQQVMRTVAHVVGQVARDMDEGEESGSSPVAEVLATVSDLLEWYLEFRCDENEVLSLEVEQVRLAVIALSLKVTKRHDEERRQF